MNPHLQRLKVIAAQVAESNGLRSFRGLKDFCLDVVADQDTAAEIAAKVVHYFCIEDGKFNGFIAGISLAVQFLKETHPDPPTGSVLAQSLKDLRNILTKHYDPKTAFDWIISYYK